MTKWYSPGLEDEAPLKVNLPKSWLVELRHLADDRKISVSEQIRRLVSSALRRAGRKVEICQRQRDKMNRYRRRHNREKRPKGLRDSQIRARQSRVAAARKKIHELDVRFEAHGEIFVGNDSEYAHGCLRSGKWHHDSQIPREVFLYHLRQQYLKGRSIPPCWLNVLYQYEGEYDFTGRTGLELK